MSVNLLNDNQQRRLGTHLGLLSSDLANLAAGGTLAINIAGSFLLGFIMRLATGSTVIAPDWSRSSARG